MKKYNASIERFCQPVLGMIDFINKFFESKKLKTDIVPPFQFELIIIPPVANIENKEMDDELPEDSDDDDIDDNNNNNNDNDKDKLIESELENDIIGNIENRLKKNNIEYIKDNVNHNDDTKKSEECYEHIYGIDDKYAFNSIRFNELLQKLIQKKNNSKMDNIHKKRYCIIIDFRQSKSELYIIEPLESNKINNNLVDEGYMQLSYNYILPGKNKNDIITASNAEYQICILSFQVFRSDKIKCYWYRHREMSRFFPNDILNLWQIYFEHKFSQKYDMEKLKKKVNDKYIIDKEFMTFYEPIDFQ